MINIENHYNQEYKKETDFLYAIINDRDEAKNRGFIELLINSDELKKHFTDIIYKQPGVKPIYSPAYQKTIDKITKFLTSLDIGVYERQLNSISKSGVKIISYDNPSYPRSLKLIDDPPLVLFMKGNVSNFNNCASIVGTRKPSDLSRIKAREISRDLAINGYVVVSGLALGIDTEAHIGAIETGGKTMAILPSNINDIYPSSNRELSYEIVMNGALISEISENAKFHKGRYITRNRITSGISNCVIVIECHDNGGTLRQVEMSIKQGRKTYVLTPIEENANVNEGYMKLIKMGATPFSSSIEILEWLENYPPNLNIFKNKSEKICSLFDFA